MIFFWTSEPSAQLYQSTFHCVSISIVRSALMSRSNHDDPTGPLESSLSVRWRVMGKQFSSGAKISMVLERLRLLPNLIRNGPNLRAISFWVTRCDCKINQLRFGQEFNVDYTRYKEVCCLIVRSRLSSCLCLPRILEVVGLLEWHVDHPLGPRPCTTTIEAITSLRVFLFFFSLINFVLYFSKYQGYDCLKESFAIVTTRTMTSISSWRRCKSETLGRRRSCASFPKYSRSWRQS